MKSETTIEGLEEVVKTPELLLLTPASTSRIFPSLLPPHASITSTTRWEEWKDVEDVRETILSPFKQEKEAKELFGVKERGERGRGKTTVEKFATERKSLFANGFFFLIEKKVFERFFFFES